MPPIKDYVNISKFLSLSLALSLVVGTLFPVAVSAQEKTDGAPLLLNGDFVDEGEHWGMVNGRFTVVAAPVPVPSGRAIHLELNPPPDAKPWSIQLNQELDSALKTGEELRLRFWARSDTPIKIAGLVQRNEDPYDTAAGAEVDLTADWKEFDVKGVVPRDFEAGKARLNFQLGYGAAKIDLAGVRLEATGRDATAEAQKQEVPVNLIANGDLSAPLDGNWAGSGNVTATVVPALVKTYKQAVRVTTTVPEGANPWDFQLGQVVNLAVPRESKVYLRAYMRTAEGTSEARVGLVYEKAAAPNTKVIYQSVKLGPVWKEFRFVGTTPEAFGPGESQAKFFFGYGAGTGSVEIAGVRLESYGRAPNSQFDETAEPVDYWNGSPHDDSWKAAALERIEKIRKADFAVRVVDKNGKAVPNAQVKVIMTRHAFRWGVAGKAARLIDTKDPDNLRFQSEVKRLYNTFTFENDLKWNEKVPDLERLRAVDMALGWLHANDFEVRGHNLVWGNRKFLPGGVIDLPPAELKATIEERVKSYAKRYRGQVYVWDVVNEASDNTELWEKVGWDNFANTYKWARETDPDVMLAYNDYNISDLTGDKGHRAKVLARVKTILDNGAPLDILGDQAHMGAPLTPVPNFLKALDEEGASVKHIEITEFDLAVKDDKVHGDYIRDILIAAFSQPKVSGFIQWGMWQGDQWLSDQGGAMFRTDWSKRPAEEAYEDLVLKQWWTRVEGKTDTQGEYKTRGFFGDYEVSATLDGKAVNVTAKLGADGEKLTLILP